MIDEGMDLEDDVSYVSVTTGEISCYVQEGDKSYSVSIELDENFRIESMKCECSRKKCKHMTALIHSTNFLNNRYIDFDYTINKLDKDKLISFLREEITYIDECLNDFKDKFREDIIKSESLPHDEELYVILEEFDWENDLLNFLQKNLKELYEEKEYKNILLLISIMFDNVIEKVTFDSNSTVNACYDAMIEWIYLLCEKIENNVFDFLTDLLKRNYSALYLPFAVLMKFYGENFNSEILKSEKRIIFLRFNGFKY